MTTIIAKTATAVGPILAFDLCKYKCVACAWCRAVSIETDADAGTIPAPREAGPEAQPR